jgi:DNA-binding CsgD family transcriptional regulator
MREFGDSNGIEQQNELGQQSFSRVLITAGFSLTMLIDLLYTWGGWVFGAASAVNFQSLLLIWSIPHQITNALIFLLLALVGGKLYRRYFRQILVLSALLIIVGHLFLEVLAPFIDPTPALVLAAFCIGSGCSLLLGAWVVIFARNTTAENHTLILLALVIFAILYLLLSYLPSSAILYVLPLLVVAIVAIALYILHLDGNAAAQDPNPSARPHADARSYLPIGRTFILLRDPLFCAASIIFAVPITRISALMNSVDIGLMNLVTAFVALVAVAILLIFRYGPRRNNTTFSSFDIPRLVRYSLPLVATALVLYTIIGSLLALPVSVAVFVLFYLVWLLMIPTCIETAAKLEVSPLLCYGLAACVINIVFAVSTWLGASLIAGGLVFGVATLSVCMLLVLYVLMMVLTFFNNKKAVEENTSPSTPDANGRTVTQEGSDQSSPSQDAPPDIESICIELAELHQLTPRENEILLLLAHGRDIPHIATQLFISKNTVRTHTKSVYAKLDVHSRQKLLDLLEEKQRL